MVTAIYHKQIARNRGQPKSEKKIVIVNGREEMARREEGRLIS
jgi:hypothetical protein